MTDNVIFLDIDGVVATPLSTIAYRDGNGLLWSIDPTLMRAIVQIMRVVDAKMVLSSTWRYPHSLSTWKDVMRGYNARDVVWEDRDWWCTPNLLSGTRGSEIKAWLEANEGKYDEYLILDDDDDFDEDQMSRFVQTDANIGLTFEKCQEILYHFDAIEKWKEYWKY